MKRVKGDNRIYTAERAGELMAESQREDDENDEGTEHPGCITGADFVKALMGIVEPRTDKEVEDWLRDLRVWEA